MLDVYAQVAEDVMAMPSSGVSNQGGEVCGRRHVILHEAMMQSGLALQAERVTSWDKLFPRFSRLASR